MREGRYMVKRKGSVSGFTLAEIMVVVGIIAILGSVGIPNFMRARHKAQSDACIANLRQIDQAMQMWALDTNQAETAIPDWIDLVPQYLKSQPECPSGVNYTLNSVADGPSCSLENSATEEHILPNR